MLYYHLMTGNPSEIDPFDETGDAFDHVKWDKDTEISETTRRMLRNIARSREFYGGDLINPDPRKALTAREVARNSHEIAEEDAAAISERLVELKVKGARTSAGLDNFTARDLERLPGFAETPYLIDDVHYNVYRHRKEQSPSPYLTVSLKEILSELAAMRETHVDLISYQRKNSKEASEYFERMGIEENSIHEVMSTAEGRQMMRSLHRIFQERPLVTFLQNFKKEQKQRMDERPIDLRVLAYRVVRWHEVRYRENKALGETVIMSEDNVLVEFAAEPHEKHDDVLVKLPADSNRDEDETAREPLASGPEPDPLAPRSRSKKQLDEQDPDEMMWYELRMRELDRVKAFAKPVVEYLEKLAATN